jgi:hypothetical protein
MIKICLFSILILLFTTSCSDNVKICQKLKVTKIGICGINHSYTKCDVTMENGRHAKIVSPTYVGEIRRVCKTVPKHIEGY